MPKTPRSLEVEQIAFTANTLKTRELPLAVYSGLTLLLSITHTNGTSAVITTESLAKIISKINLVINGQDTVISLPFYHLVFQNKYDFSVTPYNSIFLTDTTQGTSFVALYLPFALTRAMNPDDTLLDLRKASTAVLEVSFGSSIGTNVTSVDSGSLQIFTHEFTGVRPSDKFARHEFGYGTEDLTSTGARQHKLEVGSNNQFRRLWLYALDSSGDRSDSEIDNISVKSRSHTFINNTVAIMKAKNTFEYAVSVDTGVYVVDFTTSGRMTRVLDARRMSELILEVNSLVSDGSIEVVREKVMALP